MLALSAALLAIFVGGIITGASFSRAVDMAIQRRGRECLQAAGVMVLTDTACTGIAIAAIMGH